MSVLHAPQSKMSVVVLRNYVLLMSDSCMYKVLSPSGNTEDPVSLHPSEFKVSCVCVKII